MLLSGDRVCPSGYRIPMDADLPGRDAAVIDPFIATLSAILSSTLNVGGKVNLVNGAASPVGNGETDIGYNFVLVRSRKKGSTGRGILWTR